MKIVLEGKVVERWAWLQYCKSCGRDHYVMNLGCPTCNVYETPQPVSENVRDHCTADYSCDGCIAYRDHTNPY